MSGLVIIELIRHFAHPAAHHRLAIPPRRAGVFYSLRVAPATTMRLLDRGTCTTAILKLLYDLLIPAVAVLAHPSTSHPFVARSRHACSHAGPHAPQVGTSTHDNNNNNSMGGYKHSKGQAKRRHGVPLLQDLAQGKRLMKSRHVRQSTPPQLLGSCDLEACWCIHLH